MQPRLLRICCWSACVSPVRLLCGRYYIWLQLKRLSLDVRQHYTSACPPPWMVLISLCLAPAAAAAVLALLLSSSYERRGVLQRHRHPDAQV